MPEKKERVVCQCCGRQIVSRSVDDDKAIGPASLGCMRLVGGYACSTCTKAEQEWNEVFGEY